MVVLQTFQETLDSFLAKFNELVGKHDYTTSHYSQLEHLINEYAHFITNEKNQKVWEQLELQKMSEWNQLLADLRKQSARAVAMMEKYRALKLRDEKVEITDYFQNIESCIEEEFGSFRISFDSKVLLVGSGAFPMTPLLIAKRTGAEVVGIDIDEEAINLGRDVVERLGRGLNIKLEKSSVEDLELCRDLTHVIFSSTVESKYDILDQLYELTDEQVVVAMRYGDQLKSLFNYPMREVDENKWRLVENVIRPNQIFDIALYKKIF